MCISITNCSLTTDIGPSQPATFLSLKAFFYFILFIMDANFHFFRSQRVKTNYKKESFNNKIASQLLF